MSKILRSTDIRGALKAKQRGFLLNSYRFGSPTSSLLTGLLQYWKLDGNSNNSVSANNGTDTAITYSAGNGKLIQGAGFNGTTSKIVLGAVGITGAGTRTVSFWAKRGAATTIKMLFGSEATTPGAGRNSKFVTGVNSAGDIYWNFNDSDFYTAGGKLNTSSFVHVVGTYSGGTLSTSTIIIYVDNVAQSLTKAGVSTLAANTQDQNNLIGIDQSLTAARFFDGAIDEIGVWDRVLSAGEISTLYNGGTGLSHPF